MHKSILWTRK